MHPTIRLVAMPEETNFAPLGVLGYCLMRTSFLAPVLQAVTVPLKTVDHAPAAKVLDVLVSILAGCRAITQINTRLRPDLALACAWGRPQFAAQATVARTLDSFSDDHVAQLRHGCELLFRRESQTLRHPFAEQWLWLDIDLTPLPASKYAEASTKGKISPKKTCMAANWHACMPRSTTRRSSHGSTQATRPVPRPTFRSSTRSRLFSDLGKSRRLARSCARMVALAATAT